METSADALDTKFQGDAVILISELFEQCTDSGKAFPRGLDSAQCLGVFNLARMDTFQKQTFELAAMVWPFGIDLTEAILERAAGLRKSGRTASAARQELEPKLL